MIIFLFSQCKQNRPTVCTIYNKLCHPRVYFIKFRLFFQRIKFCMISVYTFQFGELKMNILSVFSAWNANMSPI